MSSVIKKLYLLSEIQLLMCSGCLVLCLGRGGLTWCWASCLCPQLREPGSKSIGCGAGLCCRSPHRRHPIGDTLGAPPRSPPRSPPRRPPRSPHRRHPIGAPIGKGRQGPRCLWSCQLCPTSALSGGFGPALCPCAAPPSAVGCRRSPPRWGSCCRCSAGCDTSVGCPSCRKAVGTPSWDPRGPSNPARGTTGIQTV